MSIAISFEVFPPQTPDGLEKLGRTSSELASVDPVYISVTYGADGSARDRSFAAIRAVRDASRVDVAGHVTCVGQSRREVADVVDRYLALGVRHIVALRGDPPRGVDAPYEPHPDGHRSTAELVAAIKQRRADVSVSVSAYPERHPQSPSYEHDLDVLEEKVDAGADEAITQMFFDNALFLDYLERVRARGIEVPVVPGIFPIHSFEAVASFAARCGATIPAAVAARFEGLDDDPVATREVAADVAADQIRHLARHGIERVHLYTLNRSELALAVCERLSLAAA